MPRPRHVPRRPAEARTVPFASAEEAWFWYARCEKARRDGARFEAGRTMARPCDPDDVALAALGLARRGVLGRRHLGVLAAFGWLEAPPDARRPEHAVLARLWDEALDRLSTVLRGKGIVA